MKSAFGIEMYGYEGLAEAIIMQAVEDYTRASKTLELCLKKNNGMSQFQRDNLKKRTTKTIIECRTFFTDSLIVNIIFSDNERFLNVIDEKIREGLVYDRQRGVWK